MSLRLPSLFRRPQGYTVFYCGAAPLPDAAFSRSSSSRRRAVSSSLCCACFRRRITSPMTKTHTGIPMNTAMPSGFCRNRAKSPSLGMRPLYTPITLSG